MQITFFATFANVFSASFYVFKLKKNISTFVASSGVQSKFTQDLVRLLSTCTSKLLWLRIFNTPLTTVPDVVCRLSNIQFLNLDHNQLASLPSNCFARMRNLAFLTANYNRLTSLQVC